MKNKNKNLGFNFAFKMSSLLFKFQKMTKSLYVAAVSPLQKTIFFRKT